MLGAGCWVLGAGCMGAGCRVKGSKVQGDEKKFKILIKCISLVFCLSSGVLNAQILRDTATLNLITKGINYIYDFQFKNAGEIFNKISQSCPGHPIVPLFSGIITYWENYPLLPSSDASDSFEKEHAKLHCIM